MTAQTPRDRLKAAMGEGWECRVEEPDDACREWYAVARLYCNAFVQVSAIEPTPDAAVDALLAARVTAFPSNAAPIDAAVAAERERCAKICDDMSGWRDWAELKHPNFPGAPCEAGAAADWLAAAIRSTAPDETPPAAGRTET